MNTSTAKPPSPLAYEPIIGLCEPRCARCNSPIMFWVYCEACGGEGERRYPPLEENWEEWQEHWGCCDFCQGRGGWWICINGDCLSNRKGKDVKMNNIGPEEAHNMLVDGLLYIARNFNLGEDDELQVVDALVRMRDAMYGAGSAMVGFFDDLIEAVRARDDENTGSKR